MKFVPVFVLVGFRVLAVPVPPMPVSPYEDTEMSTNVAFNSERSDVKEFEFEGYCSQGW